MNMTNMNNPKPWAEGHPSCIKDMTSRTVPTGQILLSGMRFSIT